MYKQCYFKLLLLIKFVIVCYDCWDIIAPHVVTLIKLCHCKGHHIDACLRTVGQGYSTAFSQENLIDQYGVLTKKNLWWKKKCRWFVSAVCLPDILIPHGLSTLYRCSLTTMAQDIPFLEIPLIGDCCNSTLVSPYLTIRAWISCFSFVWVLWDN